MHFYFFEGRIVTGAAMGKINPDTSQSYTIMTMTYDAMHLNIAFPGWTSTMLEQAVATVASGTASGYAATLRPLRVGHTAAQVVPTFLRSGCWTLTVLAKLEVRVHLKDRTATGSFVEVKAARLLYHASGNNLIQSGDSFTFQDIPYGCACRTRVLEIRTGHKCVSVKSAALRQTMVMVTTAQWKGATEKTMFVASMKSWFLLQQLKRIAMTLA